MRLNNNLIISQSNNIKPTQNLVTQKKSFQEILSGIEKKQDVKFSKHALERLRVRNIDLSNTEISKINGAIQQAEKKGVREALILMDNKAFIASVKNRTIITAASDEQLKENIFTNIDGAVII
ncbi:TIGR02530 family flagellar biosynthesis protein [Wukongibacter baidiensis]|uniref:TIGR02530 family flagellar biosynthesis protein n=1 Tax=Wukongibacter baidiensis TaxID=1723361 RepID=UPI003D7F3FD1